MSQYDRDWYRGKHPPACTCVECASKRNEYKPVCQPPYKPRKPPIVDEAKPIKQRRDWRMNGKRITSTILNAIAVILALLTGLAVMAWLLPTSFANLGDWLIRTTGNQDIYLNFARILLSPLNYMAAFGIMALVIKWFANKF